MAKAKDNSITFSNGIKILRPDALLAIGPHNTDSALYLAGSTIVMKGIAIEQLQKELDQGGAQDDSEE